MHWHGDIRYQRERKKHSDFISTIVCHGFILSLINIHLRSHENIDSGPIHLPEEELYTSGYWFSFSEEAATRKSTSDIQQALLGLANVLVHIAPLYLMCDPQDIRVVPQMKAVQLIDTAKVAS